MGAIVKSLVALPEARSGDGRATSESEPWAFWCRGSSTGPSARPSPRSSTVSATSMSLQARTSSVLDRAGSHERSSLN
jgi:hypothetical protein